MHERRQRVRLHSGPSIKTASREARTGLADLDTSVDSLPRGRELGHASRQLDLRFTESARHALALIAANRPPPRSGRYATASCRICELPRPPRGSQDDSLSRVEEAGTLLGRLGGLASFVIAFVLPTGRCWFYRQITRQSRVPMSSPSPWRPSAAGPAAAGSSWSRRWPTSTAH